MTVRSSHLADEQDRIDAEASAWVVRGDASEMSPDERRDLNAWLGSDVRHARTYHAIQETWETLPALTSLRHLAPVEANADDPVRRWRPRVGHVVAAAASVAALVAALVLPPTLLAPRTTHYSTQIAETRELRLEDGSTVTLGPRSGLDIRFNGSERRVALTSGEAFFEVAHDRAHPFIVDAGPSVIRVVGTRFDVNHAGGAVQVAVAEGIVQVGDSRSAPGSARPTRTLHAGQRLEVARAPSLSLASPTFGGANPGGWREGRLVYENSRLADLVADVNRYYAPGIRIADEGVGDLRVTAAFNVTEIPAFFSALGGVVPVIAVESPGGGVIVRGRAGRPAKPESK